DLCLDPSPNVARVSSLVRARVSAQQGGGWPLLARNYRLLEKIAVPGEDESSDAEEFFLGFGPKRLGKQGHRRLVESQEAICDA
ncbi:unnamed protein product, partial [Choristocarpus tenellus]